MKLISSMSESWERPDETLEKVVNMKNFTFISNPHQRKNKMELLQSQAPAERELLGNSAVRTLDIRV